MILGIMSHVVDMNMISCYASSTDNTAHQFMLDMLLIFECMGNTIHARIQTNEIL